MHGLGSGTNCEIKYSQLYFLALHDAFDTVKVLFCFQVSFKFVCYGILDKKQTMIGG